MTKKKPVNPKLELSHASTAYLGQIINGVMPTVNPDNAMEQAEKLRDFSADVYEFGDDADLVDLLGDLYQAIAAATYSIGIIQKQLDAFSFIVADMNGLILEKEGK